MATLNLTAASIAQLRYKPSGPSRQVLWDAKVRGLGVRVTPAQGRQYVLNYRFHGRSRLMSMGRVSDFKNITDARESAAEALRRMRCENLDPLVERDRDKAAGTLTEMFKRWLAEVERKRSAKTHETYEHLVEHSLKPDVGRHRPADLARPEVRRLHARLTAKRGPISANRAVAILRAAYGWALKQDDGTLPTGFQNPAQGIEFNREKPRDEFIRPDELPALAREIAAESDPWARSFLWLALLTGARGGELVRLRWADVSLATGELVFRDTKNKSDFRHKLSAAAVDILRNIPRAGAHVFPPRRSDGEAAHMAKPRAAWASVLKRAGISRDVTLHDLRRSAGVLLSKRGFTAEQIARQLNHKSNITSKVYVRIADELQQEMADALAGASSETKSDNVATLPRERVGKRL